ncbi:MAG TPA: nuclear transport factor 2 family protein [Chlamydiales bacterium]|jgi:ketosteroid isomerase-like protein|nr:nuclear transport factor 2 family protein [Chlamydiales bacterium]
MTEFIKFLVVIVITFMCGAQVLAQTNAGVHKEGIVLSDLPREADPNARYLFYVSGYIVQANNKRPTSPRFGVYEYEKILEAFSQRGFVVISEARTQTDQIEPYGVKVAGQVRQLLKAGVIPQHITVVGASQGSWMAMLASTYLKNSKISFVFIGACAADDGLLQQVNLHGNILFISERTDQPALCQRFIEDATGLGDYESLEVNTGEKHGFLYRPMKEWVDPTAAWAEVHSNVRTGNERVEQQLMKLQDAVSEAEKHKDLAALNRLLTDDYFFASPAGSISNKRQFIEDTKNAEPEPGQTIAYDGVKVFSYVNSALVSCVLIVKGQNKEGKDYTNRYRMTAIWVKRQKNWQMAGIHVSRMKS